MIKWDELKEGDKLYTLTYWYSPYDQKSVREMRSVTIEKKNKQSLVLKGLEWKIPATEFESEWFTSKKECYALALQAHQSELKDLVQNVKLFRKEVRYIKKKISEIEAKERRR